MAESPPRGARAIASAAHGVIHHWTVADVFRWPKTMDHPGHDCFVLPRAWVPCLFFTDSMLGMGYWCVFLFARVARLQS